MTAKILPFPGPGVRAEIHTSIQLHAAGKISRQQMMTFVAGRLAEYGLKRINIGNYAVRLAEPNITITGVWPVVIIEARQVSPEPHCPACRSEVYGYLAGDEVVKVMCVDCGCIYEFKVREAAKNE